MSDRYVRVFWGVRDDPRLADIYPNDHHLAAWLRLLIAADMAWPAPADLPASVSKRSLSALVDAGVIEQLPGAMFRFHGLGALRERMQSAGRAGASSRWSERDANAMRPHSDGIAIGMPSKAEQSKAEQTHAPARAREEDIPEGAALAWLSLHGAHVPPTGGGLHRRLISLVERHGAQRVIDALSSLGDGLSDRQYVLGAENALDVIPAPDRKAAADAERAEQGKADHARRVAATKRLIAEYTGEGAA